MKLDIARQPLVPAFLTLFVLAVTTMCCAGGHLLPAGSGGVPGEVPLAGELLRQFQAACPVWARIAAGFMILFTGMCIGRIAIRYTSIRSAPACRFRFMPLPPAGFPSGKTT